MAGDPVIIYPKAQIPLMAALAEANPDKLLERAKDAQKAISKRFLAIARSKRVFSPHFIWQENDTVTTH
jgi:hypothetical protein